MGLNQYPLAPKQAGTADNLRIDVYYQIPVSTLHKTKIHPVDEPITQMRNTLRKTGVRAQQPFYFSVRLSWANAYNAKLATCQ